MVFNCRWSDWSLMMIQLLAMVAVVIVELDSNVSTVHKINPSQIIVHLFIIA